MRNKRLKIIANAFKYATASMVIGTGFLCLSNYQSSKTNKLSSINAGTVVDTKTVPFSEILTSYTTCTGNVTLELVNDPTFYSGNFWRIPKVSDRLNIVASNISLKNIYENYPILELGEECFLDCVNITGFFNLPATSDSIMISDRAFVGSGISSFDLASRTATIGSSAFSSCTNLTTISNIEQIQSLGDNAFSFCPNLSGTFVIPDAITSIPSWLFQDDSSLEAVVFHENVTEIQKFAFNNCTSLTDITFPSALVSIGQSAFDGCSGLTCNLVLPEGLTTLSNHAFQDCNNLTGKLIIPHNVITVGDYAFCGCSGFDSLELWAKLQIIGYNAFENCSGFTGELILPEGLLEIQDNAFKGCSGFSGNLYIPSTITKIQNSVFEGCSFGYIQFESETVPYTLGANWQPNTTCTPAVYVPYGSKAAYMANPNIGFTADLVHDGFRLTDLRLSTEEFSTIMDDGTLSYITEGVYAQVYPLSKANPDDLVVTWTANRDDYVEFPNGPTTNSGQALAVIGLKHTIPDDPVILTATVTDADGITVFRKTCKLNINYDQIRTLDIDKSEINGFLNSTDTITASLQNNIDPEEKINWELIQGANTYVDISSRWSQGPASTWTRTTDPVTLKFKKHTSIDQFLLLKVSVGNITKYCYITVGYAQATDVRISGGSYEAKSEQYTKGKLDKFIAKVYPLEAYQQPSWHLTSTDPLPVWLTISQDGEVSWNSNAETGEYRFRVEAISGDGFARAESDLIILTIGTPSSTDKWTTYIPMICVGSIVFIIPIIWAIVAHYANKPDERIYFIQESEEDKKDNKKQKK